MRPARRSPMPSASKTRLWFSSTGATAASAPSARPNSATASTAVPATTPARLERDSRVSSASKGEPCPARYAARNTGSVSSRCSTSSGISQHPPRKQRGADRRPEDEPHDADHAQRPAMEHVRRDLVAVARCDRVQVEEGPEIAAERELEEDVAQRARRQQQARERERPAEGRVGRRPRGADRDAPPPRLEPGV